MRVGILYNSRIITADTLAGIVHRWLVDQGHETWLGSTETITDLTEDLANSAFLVVVGGDGTTLLAARLAAPYSVPIMGINMGRVGFLSEATPANWQERLAKILKGENWLEKRLMLRAEVMRQGQSMGTLIALNDVVVSRGMQLRMVRFNLSVDGDPVTVYMADALIAATPTGSTAYSMAAGGPILSPQLQNFLVLPVAPHLSFEQALVLHEKAVIMVRLEMEYDAMVTADGQDAITLEAGDEVMITRYQHDSYFIRLGRPGYFYQRLMERLNYWSLKAIQ